MLHTQKGKTIAKIDILAPSKICIYKVHPPEKNILQPPLGDFSKEPTSLIVRAY